ncbi:sulfite exporter TauE/SafE family protein [Roseisalinus antarcticus]|uniref:Probable membrane transporter protein n=1 Tax=Roseisalinus antarcticus TaxID=254357 RepID=A0A1Y5SC02_9RHOB|nr:sulfite exporter TauE/SafE family protein [Roseisalinus antarcticus]SLN37340.1 Sulfite exporter TauE/SafE [Roseisalinus antarcticus]
MPPWLPLPDGIDGLVLLALAGCSALGSFITAAFGIGGGALLLAVMAIVMPSAALIPVHGAVQLGSNASRVALFWRHIHGAALPGFALGAVVGSVAGGLIAVDLPASVVQAGVGCFVIFSVLARPPAWLRNMPVVAGVVSSFLTMFFGATGLFVASYARARGLDRAGFVGTQAALMTMQHGLKLLVFGLLGFAYADWAGVIALMIAAGGLGTLTGRMVLVRTDEALFARILDILMLLISLRLIWGAFRG